MKILQFYIAMCVSTCCFFIGKSKSLTRKPSFISTSQSIELSKSGVNNFIKKLLKRSIRDTVETQNQSSLSDSSCIQTLTEYKKNNCWHIQVAQDLEITNWPQAHANRSFCVGEYENGDLHVTQPASTIITVWNSKIGIWQKIKVTVGHFCPLRHTA